MSISRTFLWATIVLALVIVASPAADAVDVLSSKECEALGFRSSEVQCRFCDLLKQQTQNDKLYGECKSCCIEHNVELTTPADVQYVFAHFSISNHKHYVENKFLGNTIYDYIEKYKNQPYYSQVRFVESMQKTPRLILWNANMTKKLEVRISGWSPDSMDQFLREKLTIVTNTTKKS